MHLGFNSAATPIYGVGPVNPNIIKKLEAPAGTTDGVANARPISVAWAPEIFVQADADGNNGLTSDEFAKELSRTGVDADVAKKLFDSFDKSKDGSLSMKEFVDGVTADNASDVDGVTGSGVTAASGGSTFQKLAESYETNDAVMTSFLNKGSAAADQYWNGVRNNAKSLLAIA